MLRKSNPLLIYLLVEARGVRHGGRIPNLDDMLKDPARTTVWILSGGQQDSNALSDQQAQKLADFHRARQDSAERAPCFHTAWNFSFPRIALQLHDRFEHMTAASC